MTYLLPYIVVLVLAAAALYAAYRLMTARTRRRVPAYCGYHVGLFMRPGFMAVLDSERCEECLKDQKRRKSF